MINIDKDTKEVEKLCQLSYVLIINEVEKFKYHMF